MVTFFIPETEKNERQRERPVVRNWAVRVWDGGLGAVAARRFRHTGLLLGLTLQDHRLVLCGRSAHDVPDR